MGSSVLNTLFSAPVLLSIGGAAAILFVVLLLLLLRPAAPIIVRHIWPITALATSVLAVGFVLERLSQNEHAVERRAIEQRDIELTAQTLAPGSVLGCLNSAAGDTVEGACEAAVFADPQTVAAAVAYVASRLALLGDGLDYARRVDPGFAERLSGVQRSIEFDRFGIAAHVLASRDGCTAERCAAFALLSDSSALKANLRVHAYDAYVARHAAAWGKAPPATEKQAPVASAAPTPASPLAEGVPPHPATVASPVPSKYSFPSAASIPPVSIMNAEPPLPAAPATNAAAPTEATPAAPKPQHRRQSQAPAAPTIQAPQSLLPSTR
jgi:hypothetical protein